MLKCLEKKPQETYRPKFIQDLHELLPFIESSSGQEITKNSVEWTVINVIVLELHVLPFTTVTKGYNSEKNSTKWSINSENKKALGNSLTTNLDSSDSQGMSSQVTEWGLGISDVPPPDSTIDSARK